MQLGAELASGGDNRNAAAEIFMEIFVGFGLIALGFVGLALYKKVNKSKA